MAYAVVRVRGTVNIKEDIADTMKMLRLNSANHCVVVPETPSYKGMLQKVKDYVTWGEIDEPTMLQLLLLRGKLTGGEPISESFVRNNTQFDSIEHLAKEVCSDKVNISSIDGLKPVFRLNPPRKGFRTVKRSYAVGGTLGYRGKDINALLERMMDLRGNDDVKEE